MSYEGWDDEKELKTDPVVNESKNSNVASDSNGKSNDEEAENTFLMMIPMRKSKQPPKPL